MYIIYLTEFLIFKKWSIIKLKGKVDYYEWLNNDVNFGYSPIIKERKNTESKGNNRNILEDDKTRMGSRGSSSNNTRGGRGNRPEVHGSSRGVAEASENYGRMSNDIVGNGLVENYQEDNSKHSLNVSTEEDVDRTRYNASKLEHFRDVREDIDRQLRFLILPKWSVAKQNKELIRCLSITVLI